MSSILLLAVLAFCGREAAAGGSRKSGSDKKKQTHEYALLFGTVFNEQGRLVRGAQVRVWEKEGSRRWEASTDNRGEFAVRLPVAAAVYIVEVTAPRYTRDTKEVSFAGDERQDVVMHIASQQQ